MLKQYPTQLDLAALEAEVLKKWQSEDTFHRSNEQRSRDKSFSFYDGPPFANGLPHYGHLLANTIKDTVPRFWNMCGYYVERRFGWDCHGLPVEFEVEKREGLKGRTDILELGVDKFNEMCRESVQHYTTEWQRVITKLGRWVDWENQYRTMDPEFMESVWWVFKSLYDKGLVYKGFKVVPYSPRITAVLSNFEANQNYKDVQDPAIVVKFKMVDSDVQLLAWTTTPWTLISNLALAVAADVTYAEVVDEASGETYILAKERLVEVYPKGEGFSLSRELKGSDLVGRRYEPLFPYFASQPNSFVILADDFVTTDSGTGIVHCAPAYGEDDNRVCLANGITIVDPLDEEARFKDAVSEYQGQYVKDADKNIIRDLKAAGKLAKHGTVVHSYPFCERTDEPLIYRSIPTWFVRVEAFKDKMIANNQEIHWVPGHLRDGRMGKWLENARDWAISRNRFWGTPIPIWECSENDEHRWVPGSIAELSAQVDAEITDIHKHFIDDKTFACSECQGTMRRVSEVFDCWFESGSMPYAQGHYPFENQDKFASSFPADFIAEGQDQTRGWFYTLAILSAALFEKPAFKNVVVNGMVLAEDGRKMSKRWRNYTDPEELISTFGADSVRLYMLNSAILRAEDLKFKDQGVKDTTRAVLLPLWNSYSFLATYAKADGWQPSEDVARGLPPQVNGLLDRWIISKFQSLVTEVHEEMREYQLYNVVPVVLEFIDDLTNWYIRLSRRRFWAGDAKMSAETLAAYNTLFYVLNGFIKVFAPFAPFITEAIYGLLHDGNKRVPSSVHLNDMPVPQQELRNEHLESNMALVRRVTELGRSLRAKHQIKTRQVLPSMLIITRHANDQEFIDKTSDLVQGELNVKNIEFSTQETKFVNLSLKPNLKLLGKRLGKELKNFRKHLDDLNESQELVARALDQVESSDGYEWQGQRFGVADFLIERGPKDDRLVASAAGVTVLLDTKLTEELIAEGLAREVVNRIQNLRKDSGLEVSDRIVLKISGSERIKEAVKANQGYVLGEVLCNEISFVEETAGLGCRADEAFEIDGETIQVGLNLA